MSTWLRCSCVVWYPLATGVPSMVATWAAALRRYGRHSLAADLQPAIKIADRGFRVNADFQQLTESELPELQAYPIDPAAGQLSR